MLVPLQPTRECVEDSTVHKLFALIDIDMEIQMVCWNKLSLGGTKIGSSRFVFANDNDDDWLLHSNRVKSKRRDRPLSTIPFRRQRYLVSRFFSNSIFARNSKT